MLGTIVSIMLLVFVASYIFFKADKVFQKTFFSKPQIYIDPSNKYYVLSKGDIRVSFDFMRLIDTESYDVSEINRLIPLKLCPVDTPKTCAVLDRNGQFVAVIPMDVTYSSHIPIYFPNKKAPEWMRIDEFEEKQKNMLSTVST
jgi:hypothetical protein